MKILYLECKMGAAGDMLMSALMELHPEPETIIRMLNEIHPEHVFVSAKPAEKCGIIGTHISVQIGGEEEGETGHHHHHAHHSHTGMHEIEHILKGLAVSEQVKRDALGVYRLIADAESKVHGKPVDAIHFHEVGMMDAVVDIVGVCLLMEALSPDKVIASPICVGSGQVKCAHGILPVPAPATALILKGIPCYSGEINGELCTPTGAALLKYFADDFVKQPLMMTEKIGYGMGKKDFPMANCVRAFWGEVAEEAEQIMEISCNLDDMTGEDIGFALEMILEEGALDSYVVPIQMKKSRPGQMLVCLCKAEDEEKMARLLLKHTTTFGLRVNKVSRYILDRKTEMRETEYGRLRIKSGRGHGVEKHKYEYEDLAELARQHGISMSELRKKLDATDLSQRY